MTTTEVVASFPIRNDAWEGLGESIVVVHVDERYKVTVGNYSIETHRTSAGAIEAATFYAAPELDDLT